VAEPEGGLVWVAREREIEEKCRREAGISKATRLKGADGDGEGEGEGVRFRRVIAGESQTWEGSGGLFGFISRQTETWGGRMENAKV
jgi:hypothetical protein